MSEKKIPVIEVFGPTIQGEGIVIGAQTFFIRLGLCDFKCTKCDSMHAVDPGIVKATAEYLSCDELFERLISLRKSKSAEHIEMVTLSGGNPAIHKGLQRFIDLCTAAEIVVVLETQGTLWQPWISSCAVVSISPKSPGMGAEFNPEVLIRFIDNLRTENTLWYLKIVIFSAIDIEFAAAVSELVTQRYSEPPVMYLSLGNHLPPQYSLDDQQMLVETVEDSLAFKGRLLANYRQLADDIMQHPKLGDARFLPQLHLLVYGNKQGF